MGKEAVAATGGLLLLLGKIPERDDDEGLSGMVGNDVTADLPTL